MTSFLDKILQQQTPGEISITIPRNAMDKNEEMTGTLRMSDLGYLYAVESKGKTWVKFAVLSIYLPVRGLIERCIVAVQGVFGKQADEKGLHDLGHTFKLTKIAFLAAMGGNFAERIQQFALAEMDYNIPKITEERAHWDRLNYLNNNTRSQRISRDFYVAPCMQPLFHREQVAHQKAEQRLSTLKTKRDQLQSVLANRETMKSGNFASSFISSVSLKFNQYKTIENDKASERLTSLNATIATLEKQLANSKRVANYAHAAIRSQQCCPDAVETTEDVTCCGLQCYKEQKICGILYRIQICQQECWAMNCLCFQCCIWPAGGYYAVAI